MLFQMKGDSRAVCRNRTLSGTALSPGLADGRAFVFRDIYVDDVPRRSIESHQVETEHARVERAIAEVIADLRLSIMRMEAALDSVSAGIFDAHELLLRDQALVDEIRQELEGQLVNAECAVQRVLARMERKLRSAEDEIFQERASDIQDIARRLLRVLAGIQMHSLERMPEGSVLVARTLLPSDTVFFPRRHVAAVLVEFGGPGSHCALLTRQIGIPGVCQIPGLMDTIEMGDDVIVDGFQGTAVVAPDESVRQCFRAQLGQYRASMVAAIERCRDPAITLDRVAIPVMANIGGLSDAERAVDNGADGVGLYRSEWIFLPRKTLPTEEELIVQLSRTLAPLRGRSIAVRLLDIGGDKNLPYLRLPAEENPSLGQRGVRLLLRFPELLRLQLRALLRLSREHDIVIIVPMVTFPEEMIHIREVLQSTASELGIQRLPQLGAMIETPAAALNVAALSDVADVLSVGTNDLTQYTMAAGRENPFVSNYFKHDHDVMFRLLRIVCADAGDKIVSVCGELAGQPDAVPRLVAAGVRMLSVAPPLIPSVKEAVRRCAAKAS